MLNHRFIQLFFRAWADARPIAQHDRPRDDRFIAYIGSLIGVGSHATIATSIRCRIAAKLAFAGLIAPQAKSLRGCRGFISGLFDVDVEIDEFVGSWLVFEDGERTQPWSDATAGSASVCSLGASIFSVQDKIRIRIFIKNMAQYQRFLPTGDLCEPLADAVFFYIGDQLEWEVELAIPGGRGRADAARLASASSAGRAGCRQTGPRPIPIGAIRAFIRQSG